MELDTDKEIIAKIKQNAERLVKDIEATIDPSITLPLRSFSNVHFDSKLGYLFLGDKRTSRNFLNIAHTRKFMQSMMIAEKCKELLEMGKSASIRELYYELKHTIPGTKENTFEGQTESDPLIEDLETMLDSLREHLHLKADSKGNLFGEIVIKDMGDLIDCSKLGKSGLSIPSIVDDYEFVSCNAKYILVVETKAMVDRLVEEKFHIKNHAILIGLGGQAARGARRLIHIMHERLKLPVYTYTDGDPWGYYIHSVVKTGSVNLAYESRRLATPSAKFIGMTMADIETYGLQKVTEKLKDVDKTRAKQLLKYEWFKTKEWTKEITTMIEKGVRIEQQALASKSLDFVANEYLPKKIAAQDFIE
ncbi:MAG: DNA topoisomerase IV subunit A [DPANN group archaeon]|nr:DNA topoisomerase IV subunit A [DPANN group archaeon]